MSSSSFSSSITPLWEMTASQLDAWMTQDKNRFVEPSLRKPIQVALQSLQPLKQKKPFKDEPPPSKKQKLSPITVYQDPYHIWFVQESAEQALPNHQFRHDKDVQDDIPTTAGGKLAQLSLGGLMNAMAGTVGGVVHHKTPVIPSNNQKVLQNHLTLQPLHDKAQSLHRAIQAQVRADILQTTPLRIQQFVCPDVDLTELAAIRKRIVDTVVLGKGLKVEEDETTATAAAALNVHDVEKFKKCQSCGNNDQALFVLDRKNGDVICSQCGTVVSESLMHEGSAYRKFEGEADRNHHGDATNPLYSNAHNMGTTLGGISTMTSGIGGFNSSKRNLETILRNAHAYTELNISNMGKTDRRTRIGYKDKQKKDAFIQMSHVGDALELHDAVVQRAKELFAGFRDDRELVQQFKGVLAACLWEAFDQLALQGQQLLKQQEQEAERKEDAVVDNNKNTFLSKRAARRNELHHANLAGKGGLLLDFDSISKEKPETTASSASSSPKAEEKPAAQWDLEDCRSWLLEASRSIAQQWVDERNNSNSKQQKQIPAGSLEELEGMLVEHAITLCEYLESELQKRNSTTKTSSKRVVTPRVTDMSKLGIKWQHGHERGSGGKGGVGGSGHHHKSGEGRRSAGQILILLTAKKLGSILKDPFAGEAIHRELRAVVGRQEAKKLKERREEASRQRLQQMQRKPWLQARIQT